MHFHPRLEEPKKWAISGYIRPFSSCYRPLFQGEAKSEAIDIKVIFVYSHANKTLFHNKGFALNLVLKMRVFETRKVRIGPVTARVHVTYEIQP